MLKLEEYYQKSCYKLKALGVEILFSETPPPHGLKTNCAPAQFVNAILEILIIDEPAMTNE